MKQSKKLEALIASVRPQSSTAPVTNPTYNYEYLSWPAGAGKTHWAINYCKKQNRFGSNCLIVVPTTDLADSYVKRGGSLFKTIHNRTTNGNVIDEINSHIRHQSTAGAVPNSLVITEKAFEIFNPYIDMGEWILIKDEATEPLKIQFIKLTDSKEKIESWLKLTPVKNSKNVCTVTYTEECPITTDEKDGLYGNLHEFKERNESDKLTVLVDKDWIDHKEMPALKYCVFQKPTLYQGYKKVIFMAAYFEDTYMYQMYQNAGVIWKKLDEKPNRKIDTSRAKIHFFSEIGQWSGKRRKESMDKKGNREIQKYIDWFLKKNRNIPFVYCVNNEERYLQISGNGERMTAVCHGLNQWSHHTIFLSMGSYLISCGDECFYRHWGVSTSDARGLRNTQMIYQQLMRTNLRDPDGKQTVHIFVPTFKEACELLRYLPEAEIQDCHKGTISGKKTGITATLKSTWTDSHTRSDEGEIPHDESVVVHYMDGVFARSIVNVTYQNGDAYLGDEASVQRPADTSAQIIICKSEGGNNVYTSPLNMQTIQPEISNPNTPKKKGAGAPVRTGSLVLNHIMRFCEDISVKGMLPHQIAFVKKYKLHAFVTGQFPAGSSFKKEECTGNNDFIGFDLDDTEIPLKSLLNVFRGLELLHYTTISDDENSPQRRYRIVVACTRTMNLGEHQRIMSHYQSKIEKLAKVLGVKHGLDPSKLKAYSKFFMPHKESQKEHLKSRRKPLDVDHLLSTIPLAPIVVSPAKDDLDYRDTTVSSNTSNQMLVINPLMIKCQRLVDQMCDGNRSSLAVKIGGMAKHLSPGEQDEIFASMLSKGVDKSAMKSAKRYAGRG